MSGALALGGRPRWRLPAGANPPQARRLIAFMAPLAVQAFRLSPPRQPSRRFVGWRVGLYAEC